MFTKTNITSNALNDNLIKILDKDNLLWI